MGKVLKVREVGEPILEKQCNEVNIKNINGDIIDIIVKKLNGFFARLVQHECDHLNGIVFSDKVKGPNGFATKENIVKYNLRNEK